IGPTILQADRRAAVVGRLRRREEIAEAEAVDPAVAVVVELREESLERQARSGLDLIIEAAGKAEARALIAIFAEIDCRLHRNRSAAEVNRAGRRLDVVDVVAVSVVAAADEHAELMMRAEARGASGA